MKVAQVSIDGFSAELIHPTDIPMMKLLEIQMNPNHEKQAYEMLTLIRNNILNPVKQVEFNDLTVEQISKFMEEYFSAPAIEMDWEDVD